MTSRAHTSLLRGTAVALACGLGLAQGAWAVTACEDLSTACFDGAVIPSPDNPDIPDDQRWGMSAAQRDTLIDEFGLSTVSGLSVWPATDLIDVSGNFLGADPIGSIDVPFTWESTWSVESTGGIGLIEDAYLLFLTATNHGVLGASTDYDEIEVGLSITGSPLDWVIVEGEANGTPLYFLGISLGDLFEAAGATTLIDVAYYLDDPFIIGEGTNDQNVVLPRLEVAIAGTLVPEPGTGLLVGLGLILLGGARRRLH